MALIFTSSYFACIYIDKRIKIIKHKFLGLGEAGWMSCHVWRKPRFSIFLVQFVKSNVDHKHYFISLSKQNRREKVMLQCFPWYILEIVIDLTRTGNGTIT